MMSCNLFQRDKVVNGLEAYLLGFIYADGYISNNCLGIKLKLSDKNHLYKFKNSIKSEHKILEITADTPYKANYKYCCISINDKHLINSLENKGVLYKKSKILVFPTESQVPNYLLPHFIRGYFDGDGSIYEYSKTHAGSVSFVGTEKFLNSLLSVFKTFLNTNAHVHKYKNKDIYDLKLGGTKIISSIYSYLYLNASIFLDRKKDRFLQILMANKIDVQRL